MQKHFNNTRVDVGQLLSRRAPSMTSLWQYNSWLKSAIYVYSYRSTDCCCAFTGMVYRAHHTHTDRWHSTVSHILIAVHAWILALYLRGPRNCYIPGAYIPIFSEVDILPSRYDENQYRIRITKTAVDKWVPTGPTLNSDWIQGEW